MGQSYPVYNTSHQLQHGAKEQTHHGKAFRQNALGKNTMTNFTTQEGFEKPQRSPSLGPMPHKGEVDKSGLAEQIADLRSVHFGLGKDQQAMFSHQSSKNIGAKVQSARH